MIDACACMQPAPEAEAKETGLVDNWGASGADDWGLEAAGLDQVDASMSESISELSQQLEHALFAQRSQARHFCLVDGDPASMRWPRC